MRIPRAVLTGKGWDTARCTVCVSRNLVASKDLTQAPVRVVVRCGECGVHLDMGEATE